ncbi:germ cell nuclear acidic protein isoform X3 [Hippocampus zosterae]|uniref:germ cell nuclear acidic protein isoform X3 n=1 Tax=Hippocampus zosterae TaxID=109293 RepID=UPI00223D8C25|nr:germ cell nuclear acidic protein isoform X3 [Hippocampus zosterae]
MNDSTRKLFERVSKKMGWTGDDGLDVAEKKLINAIGKKRHGGTSGDHFADRSVSPLSCLSEDEDKENRHFKTNAYKNTVLIDSGDDEFDQFLVNWSTPRTKPKPRQACSALKIDRVLAVSSDDDDSGGFEKFLQRVNTPSTKPRKVSESESEDRSISNFIVDDDLSDDDFIQTKSSSKGRKKTNTPATQNTFKRPLPLSQFASPVFISDNEDEGDNIVIKSTWTTRCTKPNSLAKSNENNPLLFGQKDSPPSPFLPPVFPLTAPRPSHCTATSLRSPKRTLSAPSKLDDSSGSEEEFTSLLERLRKKNIFTDSTSKTTTGVSTDPPVLVPPIKGSAKPRSTSSLGRKNVDSKTPGKSTILKPTVSQTDPRHGFISRLALCKTPGCFLESLSNPASSYCCNFQQKKEELTSKLYRMYNSSVFDRKLPIDMSLIWNKKMRKTAGYCVTGQERGGGNRYARIELSEKVCDSAGADRLRDTLIHEMCHAATWLINGVRDGHGSLWKMYARRSTLVHPELPMVTRCHSYEIKFKFQYQCAKCQNTIGRHSKSLDTQKFVCALCTGKLVLLTPSKPRPPTPFAQFVKEHYRRVRQELTEQSHREVMQKLSMDFASKNKLSDINTSNL